MYLYIFSAVTVGYFTFLHKKHFEKRTLNVITINDRVTAVKLKERPVDIFMNLQIHNERDLLSVF